MTIPVVYKYTTGMAKYLRKVAMFYTKDTTKLRLPFSHVPSFQIGDFFLLHLISKNVEEVMGKIYAN